jgi:hypothetical protein
MSQGRGPVVDLMRPAPGVVRCCICFHAFKVEDLYVDPDGQKWDVCWGCAAMENPTAARWPG